MADDDCAQGVWGDGALGEEVAGVFGDLGFEDVADGAEERRDDVQVLEKWLFEI
jgi:hypothetical protein